MLTGHVPGMIEIPKFSELPTERKAIEDNLIYQIQQTYKEKKTTALGMSFSEQSLQNTFNHSETSPKSYIANSIVRQSAFDYLNETENSFLLCKASKF